jgi:ABC-2 type transport system ATP-binding protein
VVTALADRLGEVPGLQVVRPTLEDVYLGLIAQDVAHTTTGTPVLTVPEAVR